MDTEEQCRSELLLFPSHFCVRCEVSCGQKQTSPGHFPGLIPGNVEDPSSSSVLKKYDDCIFEFENYYIFVFATEANEEIANENDDVLRSEPHNGVREDDQWKDNQ